MEIKFLKNKRVAIGMKEYILAALERFLEDITKNAATPAKDNLFEVREDREVNPHLPEDKAKCFQSVVPLLLYICKRCRLDIMLPIGFLCTRVKSPTEDDWWKLKRVLCYLRGTIDEKLIIGADDILNMQAYVDASYAVHSDMKSHTGAGVTWGTGFLLSKSTKQKLSTVSSTEAEIVGAGDFLKDIIWARHFLQAQGFDMKSTKMYQDNMSAMKIEKNGQASLGKRSRHVNVRYFFVKDRLESNDIKVEHCNIEEMIADFFTKPLQGKKFRIF